MSKLAKSLEIRDTYKRRPLDDYVGVQDSWETDITQRLREYRLEARIGASVVVTEAAIESAEGFSPLAEATIRAKRLILEEIFGEFRLDLARLSHAVGNRDWRGANRLIAKIQHDMYDPFLN